MISVLLLCLLPLASSAPSSGCGGPLPDQPQPGHHTIFTVSLTDPGQGDLDRTFNLHLPLNYLTSNTRPTPLVLDFHGWTGSATDQMEYTGQWPQVADEDE